MHYKKSRIFRIFYEITSFYGRNPTRICGKIFECSQKLLTKYAKITKSNENLAQKSPEQAILPIIVNICSKFSAFSRSLFSGFSLFLGLVNEAKKRCFSNKSSCNNPDFLLFLEEKQQSCPIFVSFLPFISFDRQQERKKRPFSSVPALSGAVLKYSRALSLVGWRLPLLRPPPFRPFFRDFFAFLLLLPLFIAVLPRSMSPKAFFRTVFRPFFKNHPFASRFWVSSIAHRFLFVSRETFVDAPSPPIATCKLFSTAPFAHKLKVAVFEETVFSEALSSCFSFT